MMFMFIDCLSIANIRVTIGKFSLLVDNPLFWVSIAIVSFFFISRWGMKRFIVFNLFIAGCLYLMQRADAYIINVFGKQDGEFYAVLTKPLFVFIIAFLFLYNTFVNRE